MIKEGLAKHIGARVPSYMKEICQSILVVLIWMQSTSKSLWEKTANGLFVKCYEDRIKRNNAVSWACRLVLSLRSPTPFSVLHRRLFVRHMVLGFIAFSTNLRNSIGCCRGTRRCPTSMLFYSVVTSHLFHRTRTQQDVPKFFKLHRSRNMLDNQNAI